MMFQRNCFLRACVALLTVLLGSCLGDPAKSGTARGSFGSAEERYEQLKTGPKITHYEAFLTPNFEKNAMTTRVCCKIQNDGEEAIKQVNFDILGREKFYGVKTEILSVKLRAGKKQIPLKFLHSPLGNTKNSPTLGTLRIPRITQVMLSTELNPGASMELLFEYHWEALDPTREDINYRLFATLRNGGKEVCLLVDYAWLPRVIMMTPDEDLRMSGRYWFPKVEKPIWKITTCTPPGYQTVVLGGLYQRSETTGQQVTSRWASRAPGHPQLMIGQFERMTVNGKGGSVEFFLPEGSFNRKAVERFGEFLCRAHAFYAELFGTLNGNQIQVGVSSANQGGHGGYLAMTLNPGPILRDPELLSHSLAYTLLKTAAHELAHSWWGESVTSYGRGTKFLRESFANLSCWHLIEEVFSKDMFARELACLFWDDTHTHPLFRADGDSERRAYDKGPVILKIFQSEVGERTFFRILKTFATRYKDRHATFSDFLAVCNDVSGKDWKPFFDQWCFGKGCPDYRLVKFDSKHEGDHWEARIAIRNVGKGTILCPLELKMKTGAQREVFRVEEGDTSTLTYETPAKVEDAIIDPDHNTYQGSGKERMLKMLGVRETEWNWIWYWRGVAYAEIGEYGKAVKEISRAMSRHGHPGFSYSRGIAYLLMGNTDAATADLGDFIDWVLKESNYRFLGTVRYAGVISRTRKMQDLNMILRSLTGEDLKGLKQWRVWWKKNQEGFRLAPSARSLRPGGVKWIGGSDKTVKSQQLE